MHMHMHRRKPSQLDRSLEDWTRKPEDRESARCVDVFMSQSRVLTASWGLGGRGFHHP